MTTSLSICVLYLSLFLATSGDDGDKKEKEKSPELQLHINSKRSNAYAKLENLDDDTLDDIFYYDEFATFNRGKKNVKMWDHWGKWSPCTVSCGLGKMTRWRHCVSEGCSPGEKEAQIKTCSHRPCQ
ncbi:hypothetical protein NQ314_004838 [Rhamnusium bicolor]|uniref:Uncharacterized protein n=1 Tax=Rhamnusium bicolor TaxID=1586634 RepID=A0AAV8ZIH6_9CUCU|nr:hypothetical protein NQ314_004838 [Rhamnusium bicolor]